MVSDFQSMALSVNDAPLQKRVAYAEKMRKAKESKENYVELETSEMNNAGGSLLS